MLEVLWAACLLGIANLSAQVPSSVTTVAVDQNLGITTLPLWSGSAGGKNSETSSLTVFVPQPGRGNGTAVVIAPGGAYRGLASNLEGRQVADWFTARGVTAFVLKYRLGQDNPYPAPLLDAQRAVRLVRSVAKTYKLSPERIGIMGFSAGGHLAAMEATSFDTGKHDSSDPVEGLSDRPDFLILGYPWLNAMQPNSKHLITYCSVLSAMPMQGMGREIYPSAARFAQDTTGLYLPHNRRCRGAGPDQYRVLFGAAECGRAGRVACVSPRRSWQRIRDWR
jgi:acetyl esterase/lipase